MCLFLTMLFAGPRIAILFWWLFNPSLFSDAFNSIAWPILGVIFMPWTTLMYVIAYSWGSSDFGGGDWVLLAFGVLLDLLSYAGGGADRRRAYYGGTAA